MPEDLLKKVAQNISDAGSAVSKIATTQSPGLNTMTTEISSLADPLSHVGDGIFLQTRTATVIAGVCVWVAMFVSCQQVRALQAADIISCFPIYSGARKLNLPILIFPGGENGRPRGKQSN